MQDVRLLYRSGRERVLWYVLLASLAPLPLTAWLLLAQSEAAMIAEFGSLGAAHVWQIVLLLFSSLLFWPMFWLSGRYVLRVEDTADGRVRLEVWTLSGRRHLEWSAPFRGGDYHRGRSANYAAPSVNAPWMAYRTSAGLLLVVDGQGEFPIGSAALDKALRSPKPG